MTTTTTKTTTTLLCEMKKEGTPTTRLERRGPLDATRFRRQKCATHTFFCFCFFSFFFGVISSHVLFVLAPYYYYPRILLGEDKGLQKNSFLRRTRMTKSAANVVFSSPFFFFWGPSKDDDDDQGKKKK